MHKLKETLFLLSNATFLSLSFSLLCKSEERERYIKLLCIMWKEREEREGSHNYDVFRESRHKKKGEFEVVSTSTSTSSLKEREADRESF